MPRDSESRASSRRQFLKATGAAGVTAAVAGCSGDGNTGQTTATPGGGAETPPGTGTGTPSDAPVNFDQYPYGVGQTQVGEAQRVMEEAGYGPDNTYDLSWIQYQSPTWLEMANTIRSRLSSAHINMSIEQATFSELLNTTRQGNHQAYTLGWIADYPGPQNFVQLNYPPNTVYGRGSTANGARLFWSDQANVPSEITRFQTNQFERIQNNPEPTEQSRQIREDAAVKMEEGNWAAVGQVPVYHQKAQVFWYDRVDYDPPGGMGGSRAKTSTSVNGLQGGGTLQGTSGTFNSLDPVASGNTASGGKIMDMFDAPFNYQNGTTEVVNLLVSDYTTNDDFTRYEFTLKEGMQFHGDYGEVTAADIVYSIRRLVESPNSTNSRFPLSVMGIQHETTEETYTDDQGNQQTRTVVVDGSTAVEAVDEYTFAIELEKPFAYTLAVLAYSAFSVVPEGIVGDISGYQGEMEWQQFSTNPVGSGPFVFENWESGNGGEFSATAFGNYHAGAPSISGIQDAILTQSSAEYNYFINGNSDVDGIPTAQYDPNKLSVEEELDGGRERGTYGPIPGGGTLNYYGVPTIDTYYIGFNMERVPHPVRKAMAYVVNQSQFVPSVFKGRGKRAYHIMPSQVYPGGTEAYTQHFQG